ncbi:Transcriptional regulator [Dissulfuribacter thermophilus]|uniref:Transcriptional regulator n=1 Tax=Dissulfuribacter thermophilus TaxID=1156395 RepID=A0A1B9F4F8_9BACT|nr:helix-turn-helix transcriptional regulator [Dissulfuribacter thermophilus]OCC14705.1 Transcriptional regulator [Dissulfuribacter thermophilus]
MGSEKLSEYLKRERELRGISLDEISEGTKIPKRSLIYMESGKWDELPGEVFIKGFLKSYAEFIGLTPEEILLRYQEEKSKEESEKGTGQENHSKTLIKNTGIFLLILIIAIILGYFAFETLNKDAISPPKAGNTTLQMRPPSKDGEAY